jgi:dTDP-4-dehydrorhamnose reductase
MKVVVTGACGLLGAHVASGLANAHDVVGIDRHPWWGGRPVEILRGDLADAEFVQDTIARQAPELIVHCAGSADVDAFERNPEQAYFVNVELPRRLLAAAPERCRFVYISTDSIFGAEGSFHTEYEEPFPVNVYTRSKVEGERVCRDHLVVRTNFYGWSSGRKKTFAEWLFASLENATPITLFDDFFFTPIHAADLVHCLDWLIAHNAKGVFHVAGRDRVSKYEFGVHMAKLMGASMANVKRGSLRDARLAARRPLDMSLSTDKIRNAIGHPMPGCIEGLQRFLNGNPRPNSC